jgi:hypothetical protein
VEARPADGAGRSPLRACLELVPCRRKRIIEDNQFSKAFTFPRTEGVQGYHDITPRMGAAYDVFGTGRTALRVSLSKYLQGAFAGDAYTIAIRDRRS